MYPTYQSLSAMPILHGLGFLLFLPVFVILLVWSIIIKGFALWYAARNNQKGWFVVLLIVNTLGLVEILYLIFWRKNQNPAVVSSSAV